MNQISPQHLSIYADANNLYGCSKDEFLPHKDPKFENNIDLDTILNAPDKHATGYIAEVDLHVPVEVHDKFKEFPRTP